MKKILIKNYERLKFHRKVPSFSAVLFYSLLVYQGTKELRVKGAALWGFKEAVDPAYKVNFLLWVKQFYTPS